MSDGRKHVSVYRWTYTVIHKYVWTFQLDTVTVLVMFDIYTEITERSTCRTGGLIVPPSFYREPAQISWNFMHVYIDIKSYGT